MRILFIVPSLIQSGPVNVVFDLVHVMLQHGHDCEVAYCEERTDQPLNSFPCKSFKVNKIVWNKYDIIHTHGFRPDLIARIKMPKSLKYKLISTMHNLIFEDNKMYYGKVKGWLAGHFHLWAAKTHGQIITLSHTAKEYYSRYFPEQRLNVCYNTRIITPDIPDSDDVSTIERFKKNAEIDFLLGIHCFVAKRKGLDQILNAMCYLPKIGFIVIGDGPALNDLQQQCQKLNIENRVLFLGRRPNASRYLSLFDLFVLPSKSEGFPLGLLEAAALGIPSISSDIEVFKEIFPEENTLPKFSLNNINQLIQKIIWAKENRKLLAANIKQKYIDYYAPDVFYKQHLDVYLKTKSRE